MRICARRGSRQLAPTRSTSTCSATNPVRDRPLRPQVCRSSEASTAPSIWRGTSLPRAADRRCHVLKDVAGDGARGTRVVTTTEKVESAYERCRSEARPILPSMPCAPEPPSLVGEWLTEARHGTSLPVLMRIRTVLYFARCDVDQCPTSRSPPSARRYCRGHDKQRRRVLSRKPR
jgi:hypothetical protein